MNKIVKRNLIGSIFCLLIGILVFIYPIDNVSISNELHEYLSGFAGGIIGVGIYFLFQTIRVIRSPKKSKEIEIMENDERIRMINHKALSIAFKVSIFIEAIISLICACMGNMEIAKYLALFIAIQVMLYCIIYYFIIHKS